MIAVRSAGSHPSSKSTGLVNAGLNHLAIFAFTIGGQGIRIFWLVQLTDRGINAQLTEHALHTEGACLIRHDGHYARTNVLVSHQGRQNPYKRHGGADLAFTAAFQLRIKRGQFRHFQRLLVD